MADVEEALSTLPDRAAYERLVELIGNGNITILSGAGLSTESGIPDYRGPDGKRRVTAMTYGEFVASPSNRQRYWARSFVGWRRFARAEPNDGHWAVTQLQRVGLARAIITQNVDGLHQVAGTRDVIELHGNLDIVRCLNCGETMQRSELDVLLRAANPAFDAVIGEVRPDGDVVLQDEAVAGFDPPHCRACHSDMVKPDVVFFGESVPKTVVEQGFSQVEASSGLVVLGSSLQVMSGYRFVRRAAAIGIPVAIVTRGASRGDPQAAIRLDAPLGQTLRHVAADLRP